VSTQLRDARRVDPGQSAEVGQDVVGQIQDVARPAARAQDDGQQLGSGKVLRTDVQEALPRPNRFGQLFQPEAVLDRSWRGDCPSPAKGGVSPEIGAIIAPAEWRVASGE
jgi:hypothetical protein